MSHNLQKFLNDGQIFKIFFWQKSQVTCARVCNYLTARYILTVDKFSSVIYIKEYEYIKFAYNTCIAKTRFQTLLQKKQWHKDTQYARHPNVIGNVLLCV